MWRKKITIKHLLTESEKHEDIQTSMNNIANELDKHYEFTELIPFMRAIPKGDKIISSCDYANKIMNKVYDIADFERIWIQ